MKENLLETMLNLVGNRILLMYHQITLGPVWFKKVKWNGMGFEI